MSYIITKTDGTTLTTIADGQVDSASTNLSLAGPNYVGYGQKLNENLVYLLENFAGNSAPTGQNIVGQLWFDKYHQVLNVYANSTLGFVPVNGVIVNDNQPVTIQNNTIWYDSKHNQLNFYNSGTFTLIGPMYTSQQGPSGAIPVTVNDFYSAGVTHNIVQLQFGSTVIAIFNKDAAFVPSPSIAGFPLINTGLTLNNTLTGTALNSNLVGNVTGNLTGNVVASTLVGTLTGNVVGNVQATTVTAISLNGNLTGNVVGNVTATSVIAKNFTGPLTGNVVGNVSATIVNSTTITATTLNTSYFTTFYDAPTNFATANAQITGGNISGIVNFTGTSGTFGSVNTGTITVTGGSLTGLTNLASTYGLLTNFSTGNAQITGGSLTGINTLLATSGQITSLTNVTTLSATNSSFTTEVVTNFSTGNAQITGGSVLGLSNLYATTGWHQNLSVSNLLVSGGSISGLTNLFATNINTTNFGTGNVLITGGTLSGMTSITGTTGSFTNFSSTNAVITNFSTGSAAITGGILSGMTSISSTTGAFSGLSSNTLTATTLNAATIGNANAVLYGTLNSASASQTNITGVGTLTTGIWHASTIGPSYGGTGVNNGSYTLTLNNSYSLNQDVSSGATPTFTATNFSGTATNMSVGSATNAASAVAAQTLVTGSVNYFSIRQAGAKLYFYYNNSIIASLDSSGNFVSARDITAFGSP